MRLKILCASLFTMISIPSICLSTTLTISKTGEIIGSMLYTAMVLDTHYKICHSHIKKSHYYIAEQIIINKGGNGYLKPIEDIIGYVTKKADNTVRDNLKSKGGCDAKAFKEVIGMMYIMNKQVIDKFNAAEIKYIE